MERKSRTSIITAIVSIAILSSAPLASAAPGDIGSVIDTLEFQAGTTLTPDIIQINGNIFAVVYEGPNDDIILATFSADSTGNIGGATIASLTIEGGIAANPKIIHITGTTYALVYFDDNTNALVVDAITISDNGVTITDVAGQVNVATGLTSPTSVPADMVRVNGNIYAVAYTDNTGSGVINTVNISNDGTSVTNVAGPTVFEATGAEEIEIIEVDSAGSDTFALVYENSLNDANVETVTINDAGTAITSVATLTISAANGLTPDIIHRTGIYFIVAYDGSANGGVVETISISNDGSTINEIDSLQFDATNINDPALIDFTSTDANFFGVAYQGADTDGFVKSFSVSSVGDIAAAVQDTLEFDTTHAGRPDIVHRTGVYFVLAYEGSSGDITSFQMGSDVTATDTVAPVDSIALSFADIVSDAPAITESVSVSSGTTLSISSTATTATASSSTPILKIPTGSALTTVTVPSGTNGVLNFTEIQGAADGAMTPPNAITITSGNNVLELPSAAITVNAAVPGNPWRGEILAAQRVEPSTITNIVDLPAGEVVEIVVQVGDPEVTLNLAAPARITIAGGAGKTAFFVTAGTTTATAINTVCNGGTPFASLAAAAGSGEFPAVTSKCAVNNGNNKDIWTRQFSSAGVSGTPASVSGGGSSTSQYDTTAPSITSGFSSTEHPITLNGISYAANQLDAVGTVVAKTNEHTSFTITLFEDRGANSLKHIELYLNHFGKDIKNDFTETVIIHDITTGQAIKDPNNLIKEATVTKSSEGNKVNIKFDVIFKGEIPKSDILYRAWDINTNDVKIYIPNALTVIKGSASQTSSQATSPNESGIIGQPATPPEGQPTTPPVVEPKEIRKEQFSKSQTDVLMKWSGFHAESAPDTEVLKEFGIDGKTIPSWYKHNMKYVLDGKVSKQEVIKALEYFEAHGFLSNTIKKQEVDISSKASSTVVQKPKQESPDVKFESIKEPIKEVTAPSVESLKSKIQQIQSLLNNPVIQNEIKKSNQEYKDLNDAKYVTSQREQEWKQNQKEPTKLMNDLMSSNAALIAKALIQLDKNGKTPIESIIITNAYGVNTIITHMTPDYVQNDEAWWDKTKTSGIKIHSGTNSEEYSGKYITEIVMPIEDQNGNFIGIIKAAVNTEKALR